MFGCFTHIIAASVSDRTGLCSRFTHCLNKKRLGAIYNKATPMSGLLFNEEKRTLHRGCPCGCLMALLQLQLVFVAGFTSSFRVHEVLLSPLSLFLFFFLKKNFPCHQQLDARNLRLLLPAASKPCLSDLKMASHDVGRRCPGLVNLMKRARSLPGFGSTCWLSAAQGWGGGHTHGVPARQALPSPSTRSGDLAERLEASSPSQPCHADEYLLGRAPGSSFLVVDPSVALRILRILT